MSRCNCLFLTFLYLFIHYKEVTCQIKIGGYASSAKNQTEGLRALNKGEFKKALAHYNEALLQFKLEKNKNNVADCLFNLAKANFFLEDYTQSLKFLDELDDYTSHNKIVNAIAFEGKFLRGKILFNQSQIDKAHSYFHTLSKQLTKYPIPDSTLGRFFHRIGTLDYYKGDFLESIAAYEKSVKYGEKSFGKESLFVSDQINNLGVINFMMGRYAESLRFYRKSEELLKRDKKMDSVALASTYINIALVFQKKEDYVNALLFNEKAKAILIALPDKSNVPIVNLFINIASTLNKLEKYDKQHEAIQNALFYSNKYNQTLLPRIYAQMAMYSESNNQLPQAYSYFEKAIFKSRELFGESPDLANAYNNLGEFCLAHDYSTERALFFFTQAYKFFYKTVGYKHPSTSRCLDHLGGYFQKIGNYKKALTYYHSALLSVSENFSNPDLLSFPRHTQTLSDEYSISILKEKAKVLEQLANKCTDTKLKIEYLNSALQHYKQTIRFISEIHSGFSSEESRFVYSEMETDTYLKAIDLAYRLYSEKQNPYYIESAFYLADCSHAASLQVMIKEKDLEKTKNSFPLFQSELSFKKELTLYNSWIDHEKTRLIPDTSKLRFWKDKLTEVTFKLEEVRDNISKTHPAYQYLTNTNHTSVSVKNLRKNISNSEALLEYLFSDSALYVFCITREVSVFRKIPVGKDFNTSIDNVLTFIRQPCVTASDSLICKNYKKSAYSLYQLIIEPLERMIKNKSLIIIPDRKLTYLPFCTLLSDDIAHLSLNFKEYPYLVKKYPIRYLYAAGLLNVNTTENSNKKILAFAPSYSKVVEYEKLQIANVRGTDLGDLHYNKAEVASILNDVRGTGLYTANASEENFKKMAGGYDYIHLAMHAVIDDENPQYSRLIFSPGSSKTQDDCLFSYETYNLKLNTDLLVLSACNTGIGKLQKGEGILSLTRGFIFAGVRSIVMTLWSVDDKSGSVITQSFYKHLTSKKNKDEAMQLAKAEYIKNSDIMHAHPYYWAGYVVIGGNSPIETQSPLYFYIGGIIGVLVVLGLLVLLVKYYRRKNTTPTQPLEKA